MFDIHSLHSRCKLLFPLDFQELKRLKIPFVLELGNAKARVSKLVKDHDLSVVVCDFSPLKVPLSWVNETGVELDKLQVPLIQVYSITIILLFQEF